MRTRLRPAYSLLEVLVASAIFAGMILAATSTLSASSTLRSQEQSTYKATAYTQQILRQIVDQSRYAIDSYTNLSSNAAVPPGAIQAGDLLLMLVPGTIDQYGRVNGTARAVVGYCVHKPDANNQQDLFVFRLGGLSATYSMTNFLQSTAYATSFVSKCNQVSTAASGYQMELFARPLIVSAGSPKTVQVQLRVKGAIGGGEQRTGSVNPSNNTAIVPVVEEAMIETGSLNLAHESYQ